MHTSHVGDPWAIMWAPWAVKTREPLLTLSVSRGSLERMTRFELATLTLAKKEMVILHREPGSAEQALPRMSDRPVRRVGTSPPAYD
jgi:hypothetical protein